MKIVNYNHFILVCFVLMFGAMHSHAQYKSLPHGEYKRSYLVHLPNGYTGMSKLPLIIAMHGGFGNAYNIESQSQLSVKADAENFIVVYPEGVKSGILKVSSWNAGWCCGFASNSKVDDVGFINALLDTLINQYSIDTNRIYATGMSNGGFMCYRLACELSKRIAAIAPVAASMSMTSCNPERSVPIIDFHSYIDTHIPYEGGVGNGPSDHYNLSQDSVLNFWANNNACADTRDTIVNSNEYTFIKMASCENNSEVQHYATEDGGHSWPGGVSTVLGDPASNYINATDLMWSFFQEHKLNTQSLGFLKIREGLDFKIFPNPSSGIVNLEMSEMGVDFNIRVIDQLGNEIMSIVNANVIDLSNQAMGIYYIRLESEKLIMTKKISILNTRK